METSPLNVVPEKSQNIPKIGTSLRVLDKFVKKFEESVDKFGFFMNFSF